MNSAGGWTGALQKPNGLNTPRVLTPKKGHHRCHGEELWARNHEAKVGVGSLCMEQRPAARGRDTRSDPGWVVRPDWEGPSWVRVCLGLVGAGVRGVRGIADHLPHHGFLL